MSRLSLRAGVVVLCLAVVSGCADWERREQLRDVAKGWCETIRASQIMPVYPLTEDLQPGDVFLVQTTVRNEENLWQNRGFLPLPRRLTRLHRLDYADFYQTAYWEDTYVPGPEGHARPWPGRVTWDPKTRRFTDVEAPRAAFPTYKVDVRTGKGIRFAMPIKGVPFAMSLMGADRATVAVTIRDAYTYGLDEEEVLRKLHTWAKTSGKALLADYWEGTKKPWYRKTKELYLRVITRVYLTGGLNISATKTGVFGGAVDFGDTPPFKLPVVKDKETAEDYKAVLDAMNESIEPAAGGAAKAGDAAKEGDDTKPPHLDIGASVRIAFVSKGSVGLRQTFDRPLAIGYVGFDVLVLKDGQLAVPTGTFSRITDRTAGTESSWNMKWFSADEQEMLNAISAFKGALQNKSAIEQAKALVALGEALLNLVATEAGELPTRPQALKNREKGIQERVDKAEAEPPPTKDEALRLCNEIGTEASMYAGNDMGRRLKVGNLYRAQLKAL